MMSAAGLRLPDHHVQVLQDEFGAQMSRHRPADNPSTEGMAQSPDLAPQSVEFFALIGRQAAVGAPPGVALGLLGPVPDSLGRRIELPGEIRRAATGSDQIKSCRRNSGG